MKSKIFIKILIAVSASFLLSIFIFYYIVSEKLSQYKPDIEKKISAHTGYDVKIDNIDFGFIGFKLAIKLSNLEIKNKEVAAKRIFLGKTIKAEIDIIKTIFNKKFIINKILFDDVISILDLNYIASFFVLKKENALGNEGYNRVSFENFNSILIKNSKIYFRLKDEITTFSKVNLSFKKYNKKEFYVRGNSFLNESIDEKLEFKLKFDGDIKEFLMSNAKLDLYGNNVKIHRISKILPSFKLSEGILPKIFLSLKWDKGKLENLKIDANVENLFLNERIKVNSFDANIDYVENDKLQLFFKDINLLLLDYYDHNLFLDKIKAKIDFKLAKNETIIKSDDIKIYFSDMKLTSFLNFVKTEQNVAEYDVTVKLDKSIKLNNVKKYIPNIYIPNLFEWINSSLISGKIDNSILTIKNNDLVWNLNYSDVKMIYDENWPVIDDLSGEIIIKDNKLQINTSHSKFMNEKPRKLFAVMDDVTAKHSLLIINGDIDLSFPESLSFINSTPLKNGIGDYLSKLNPEGKINLGLKLKLSFMDDEVKIDHKGFVKLNDLFFNYADKNLEFSKVNGDFEFYKDDFHSNNLTLMFLNNKAKAKINYSPEKESFSLKLFSNISVDFLNKKYFNFLNNFVSGDVEYEANCKFPLNKNSDALIIIKSDLEDLEMLMPKPLKKEKGVKQNAILKFSFKNMQNSEKDIKSNLNGKARVSNVDEKLKQNVSQKDYKEKIAFDLSLENLLKAKMLFIDEKINKGYVNFGKNMKADLPRERVFLIGGNVESLNLMNWLDFIKGKEKYKEKEKEKNSLLNTKKSEKNKSIQKQKTINNSKITKKFPVKINLLAKKLNLFDYHFDSVWLRFVDEKNKIEFDGPKIKGDVSYLEKGNKKIVYANFDYLFVNFSDKSFNFDQNKNFNLKDLPNINFNSREIGINNKNIGGFSFKLLPILEGYDISDIKVLSKDYEFEGFCIWNLLKNKTLLKGKVNSNNFGNLFSKFGYKATIGNGVGDLNFSFNWDGNIFDYSLDKIVGELSFKMKEGQIIGIDPGFGKVLGLFNIDSLTRRLRLDFSDVVDKGFSFDNFSGDISFSKNLATLNNIIISGPAADIQLSGTSTINDEKLNLTAGVTPKVAQSLPLAAAIAAGNPAVGAFFWVFDKISSSKIDKSILHNYKINGTWNEPKVVEIKKNKKKNENKAVKGKKR